MYVYVHMCVCLCVYVCVCVYVCRSLCCDHRNGSREVWDRLVDSSAGQLTLTEVSKYMCKFTFLCA